MTETPIRFEFPGNPPIKKFIRGFAEQFSLQVTAQYYSVKTFYDSFDWRLYNADLLCEFNQSKHFSYLNLINKQTEQVVSQVNLEKVPPFTEQFSDALLHQQLSPILQMRALLPVASLNLQIYQISILNKDEKTVARLILEEYEEIKHRLTLEPVKGYSKAAKKLTEFLLNTMSLKVIEKTVLMSALKAQGRKAGDYSSKLSLQLEPQMSAHQAVKTLYKTLLQTIKLNEQGTIAAIDSEFLHDFRVAVRRTRTGLSQLKAALPPEITDSYGKYFFWLGQITSTARDLDVYVLNFSGYKACLPESMHEDIEPLRDFLLREQAAEQKELALQLKSKHYLTPLIDWEQYLTLSLEQTAHPKMSDLSIKQLADLKIWKIYRRVIKHGFAITEHSPAITLHDLRKNCKKLRYLIEFFQSLYPVAQIKVALKALKELQELLGDFQDCTVQEQALTQFRAKMRQSCCSQPTFSAITELVQVLDVKRNKARADFSNCFNAFASSENASIFKSLFASKA